MATISIVGNLGKDAEKKETNDRQYWQLRVCENRKSGAIEKQDWYTVFMESLPDALIPYLKKGSRVLVQGVFTPSLYNGQNGPQIDLAVSGFHLQLLNSMIEEEERNG